jgi:hypothetical protein
MKKLATATLVALAVAGTTVTAAFASSHGAMPAGLSLWDQMVWEVEHYALHMQLTLEAILAWFVSPQLGWDLLDSQALCAEQGRMTEHLFDTGMHALETFFSTVVIMAWIGVQVGVQAAAGALNVLFKRIDNYVRATAAV